MHGRHRIKGVVAAILKAGNDEDMFFVYDMVTYEIWGEERDASGIVLPASIVRDSKKLIKELKRLGVIGKRVRAESLQISGNPVSTLYFRDSRRKIGAFRYNFELRCTHILE